MVSVSELSQVAAAKSARRKSGSGRKKQIESKQIEPREPKATHVKQVEQVEPAAPPGSTEVQPGLTGSKSHRSMMKKRALQKVAEKLGYPKPGGLGKTSALLSRGDFDGNAILRKGIVKKMLKHKSSYLTGGHTSEQSQARGYRLAAATSSFSSGALRMIAVESDQVIRRVMNLAAQSAVENGKTRITCTNISAALRPLDDALDLITNAPPNALIAKARIDGVLSYDTDPGRRAAQEVTTANYTSSTKI